jgi:endonuclease-3 related protein
MLLRIYKRLLGSFGPQGWWPVRHGLEPPEWEIMVGAVLTQNTAWSNVDRVLETLSRAGIKDKRSFLKLSDKRLEELIKPSGYYKQKARKLRVLANFEGPYTRKSLLRIWGIGKETADSILLYAFDQKHFVVDAYTIRIFSRLDLIKADWNYDEVKEFFESRIPKNIQLYKEYHALIVEMAKRFCRPKPVCRGCPMERFCGYSF